MLDQATTLNSTLQTTSGELIKLQAKCKEQEKIIDGILPRGASAGLAAAFALRGKQLDLGKWAWMVIFISSLGVLTFLAFSILKHGPVELKDFALYMLIRLPLTGPLVWLAWFSAIQYGNTIRVQEDYAFKEATSKAFQGYRDHMENLSKVDTADGNTALNLLSIKTIEILAHEPLRIYANTALDANPATGVVGLGTPPDSRGQPK